MAEAGGGDADGGLEAIGHGLTFVEAVDEACGKGIARAGGALAEAFGKGDGGLEDGLAGPAHGDGAFDGVDDDPVAHACGEQAAGGVGGGGEVKLAAGAQVAVDEASGFDFI